MVYIAHCQGLISACDPPILAMSDLAAMTTYRPLALRYSSHFHQRNSSILSRRPRSRPIPQAATRQSAFQVDEVQRLSPVFNPWDWLLRLAETMRGGSLGAQRQLTELQSPGNQSPGRTLGEAWEVMPACLLPIRVPLAHHPTINHHPSLLQPPHRGRSTSSHHHR